MIRKLCKEKSSEGSPSGYANWVKFKKKNKNPKLLGIYMQNNSQSSHKK
jgi:hypothetical protein